MYNECMLNIVNKSRYNDLKDYYPYLEEYYQKTLEVLQIEDNYVLSLIICGPITIKRINRDYRNKDAVTDVISFALLDNEDAVEYEDCIELGDLPEHIARCVGNQESQPEAPVAEIVQPKAESESSSVEIHPAADYTNKTFKEAKEAWLASFEGEYIRALLERNNYNISQASRESEIDRKYFRKLMKKYGIANSSNDAGDADGDED